MTVRLALISSFIAACGIPLLIFWFWPYSAALDSKLEDANERHLVFATGASETLEAYHDSVMQTFNALVDPIQSQADISFSQDLLASLSFQHLCVIDPETGEILSYFSVKGKNFPKFIPDVLRDQIAEVLQEDVRPMSRVYRSPNGSPHFVVARDLGDRVVFASIATEAVERVAGGISFDSRGHAAVLDTTGHVIAHPIPGWVTESKDLSVLTPIAEALADRRQEVLVFFSPALQEDVVAGVAHAEGPGWTVLVPQPMSELRDQVAAVRRSALVVFSIGMALAAVFAVFAASVISHPLKQVACAANRVAGGDPSVRIEKNGIFNFREFNTLRISFNQMAERMENALNKMTCLAERDSLTGLLNKRSFLEYARKWIDREVGDKSTFALYMLDLNNLKAINDLYGHSAGDKTIVSLASALEAVFASPAICCRIGGDEFLVLAQIDDETLAKNRAGRVQNLLRTESYAALTCAKLSCSIGIKLFTADYGSLENYIAQADQAMYYAKQHGGGIQVYDRELHNQVCRQTQLSAQLKADVKNDRLNAMFQPIFDIRSGSLAGFETLARWHPSTAINVQPSEFIPIAQEHGFISELDSIIRRRAFKLVHNLRRLGHEQPVSVNVTAMDLAHPEFVSRLLFELAKAGLSKTDIILEVTEAIFDDRLGLAKDSLARLQSSGIALHLDDFGKGFSSHGLLRHHKFDAIKVDMHFVGDPHTSTEARAIVCSLIDLSDRIGASVVLEGIETQADKSFAIAQKIDRAQGFFFSPPLSFDHAIEMVESLKNPKLRKAGR